MAVSHEYEVGTKWYVSILHRPFPPDQYDNVRKLPHARVHTLFYV
jgi:hypothetical protein